jgi:transposase
MLPSSIGEYVSSDNIVQFIDIFVDKVLSAPGIQSRASKGKSREGRPCYSPNCLCKLLIYGYFNSISSSRKLEIETTRNMEVIWLMQELHPDHWTISDFRENNEDLIKQITIDLRRFLKDSDYISGKSVSTDGSKIKAYASRATLSAKLIDKKLEQVEKEIERYLTALADNDSLEDEQAEMLKVNRDLSTQITRLQSQVEELKSQKTLLESNHSPQRILYSPIRPITFAVKKRWEGQTNADYIQRKD